MLEVRAERGSSRVSTLSGGERDGVRLFGLLLNDIFKLPERLLCECSLEQSLPHSCVGSACPSWQSVLPYVYILEA